MRAAPKGCAWLLSFSIRNLLEQSRGFLNNLLNKGSDTIFRTSQVLKDVRMFVGGKMFTNASGNVSIGFTNGTGTTGCT